ARDRDPARFASRLCTENRTSPCARRGQRDPRRLVSSRGGRGLLRRRARTRASALRPRMPGSSEASPDCNRMNRRWPAVRAPVAACAPHINECRFVDMYDAAALLRLLGDETRLRLMRVLSREALNVTELTAILGLAQSGVSRHLGLLRDAGFIVEERAGTF